MTVLLLRYCVTSAVSSVTSVRKMQPGNFWQDTRTENMGTTGLHRTNIDVNKFKFISAKLRADTRLYFQLFYVLLLLLLYYYSFNMFIGVFNRPGVAGAVL